MNSLVFQPEGQVLCADEKQTLLAAALQAGIELAHSCGGNGTCGTCRVEILKGLDLLPPRTELEAEMAQDRKWPVAVRQACQIPACQGLHFRR